MPCPVIHFEIMGSDAEASRRFYSEVFGWEINADNPLDYGVVAPQAGRGISGGVAANPRGSTYVAVYAEVTDLQETLDKAEAMGGRTLLPPTEIPGLVTVAIFADPDGNRMGIMKPTQ